METVVNMVPLNPANWSFADQAPGLGVEVFGQKAGQEELSEGNYSWLVQRPSPPPYVAYTSDVSVGGQVFAVMLIMAAAVFGNLLMCYAVYRTPSLRTMANLFTVNLALSDLSLAVIVLPVWMSALVAGASNPPGQPPFTLGLCQAVGFLTVLLLLVSIATLAGISLDRYFIICHPLRYPVEITPRRLYAALAYIWLQSILLAATPLLGWGRYDFRPQTIPICNPAWGWDTGHASFLILIGMAIPFCIMVFSYTRVVQAARRQWARIAEIQRQLAQPNLTYASSSDEEDAADVSDEGRGFRSRPSIFRRLLSRKGSVASLSASYSNFTKNFRTLKTIFIVVGVFFVCWLPYVVVQFWSANHPERSLPYLADLFTTLLAFSNCAINPFMFMLLNRDFRYALRLMLARLLQMMGEEEAVHKAKMAGHRDSMVESFRLQSRASFDSGVVVEPRPDAILKPAFTTAASFPADDRPKESYQMEVIASGSGCDVGDGSGQSLKSRVTELISGLGGGVSQVSGDVTGSECSSRPPTHRWLLDAPIPPSYQACESSASTLQPTPTHLLAVPSYARADDDRLDSRPESQQQEADGPTFIVPNGNIPIIVIGGDNDTNK